MRLFTNSSSLTFISDSPVSILGITFDPHNYIFFSNKNFNLSRICFMHVRDLRRMRSMRDFEALQWSLPPASAQRLITVILFS